MKESLAVRHYLPDELAGVATAELDKKDFVVSAKGFDFPARLRLKPGANTLFVMLNGAVDRKRTPLPVFARWNWGSILGGHVLSVCDPTLYLGDSLRLGWFIGNKENHAVPGLISLVEQLRARLGIPAERVIYYGSSGGGFAALMAASLAGNKGRAIAINPQINVLDYLRGPVSRLAKVLGTGDEADSLATLSANRLDVVAALTAARQKAQGPRIVIAQNLDDAFHYNRHYLKFTEAFQLPRDGGRDREGQFCSMVFNEPGGHMAGEPKELVRKLVQEGLPFLLQKPGLPLVQSLKKLLSPILGSTGR